MITLDRARELLRQAVETQGRDFVYARQSSTGSVRCHYDVDDFLSSTAAIDEMEVDPEDPRLKTGCLVGVALDLAGYVEHHGNEHGISEEQHIPIPMEPLARTYFSIAQDRQDSGYTWGDAFDQAEDYIKDVTGEEV